MLSVLRHMILSPALVSEPLYLFLRSSQAGGAFNSLCASCWADYTDQIPSLGDATARPVGEQPIRWVVWR